MNEENAPLASLEGTTGAVPGKERKKREAKVVENDPLQRVFIDLPPHSSSIRIDGRQYFSGHSYSFREDQVASVMEIMGNAWRHENEVRGTRKAFDQIRRPSVSVRG